MNRRRCQCLPDNGLGKRPAIARVLQLYFGPIFIARRLFFFGQFVVPSIIAETQLAGKRLCLANADFSTLVQKFLNEGIVSGFFGNLFHPNTLP